MMKGKVAGSGSLNSDLLNEGGSRYVASRAMVLNVFVWQSSRRN